MARFAQAGDAPVLLPLTEDRHVQVIDVRDLASWIAHTGRNSIIGVIETIGDPYPMTYVMNLAATAAGFS